MNPNAAKRGHFCQRRCHHWLSDPIVIVFITIMLLLFLEALGALCLFVFIVWWTMFSGRKNGELKTPDETDTPPKEPPKQP